MENGTISHGILICMEGTVNTKKHRLLPVLAVMFGVLILIPLAWFGWQTFSFYTDIRQGGATSLEDRRLDASVSSLVANAQVTLADKARIVPNSGLYPELGGTPAARVTIVEFVDYQCPYCQRTAPVIRRVMMSLGERVRFIVRDFPITELHPGAKQSALAANCVLAQGQDKYWKYHDQLFADIEHQAPAELRAKAEAVGADLAAYDGCVSREQYLQKIDNDIQDALRVGVQGTPTFFVNGIKVQGALDEKTLTRVVNAVMDQLPK